MSVSKVNDAYYRKFIINHLDNKFSIEDLYDVVATLNPANDLYRIKSNAEKYADSSHKLELKMMYEFRTESSAKLFISTYQNLVQKGKSVLKAKIKDNKVLLEFKEPMVISHKQRYNDVGETQQKRISEALAFREESHLLSDVFIQTVDSLFSSGIYKLQATPDFAVRGNIRNTKEFIKYEAMTSKIEGRSFTALYKSTMHNNAIEMSPKLNNEVMEQITSAMNSRVDGLKGASLGKRIFRLSSKDGGLEICSSNG